MKRKLLICWLLGIGFSGLAQTQFFEGLDTNLTVTIVPDSNNIWYIGEPAKTLFDSAFSYPNAIFTDTSMGYQVNNTSVFTIEQGNFFSGIIAFQWMQKLDMESGADFGLIEFSTDDGVTWQNAFDNPNVYNFYGFDTVNVDTMADGTIGFSGTDSTWKNIWICFDGSFFTSAMKYRFTFMSDSVDTQQEGWILDNFVYHETFVHGLGQEEKEQTELIHVYPTVSDGRIYLALKNMEERFYVRSVVISNEHGQIVQQYDALPKKYFFDLSDQPNGSYFMTVQTNQKTETVRFILQR